MTAIAAFELSGVEVAPADANHQLRAWDVWSDLLRNVSTLPTARPGVAFGSCEWREVEALSVVGDLRSARTDIYVDGNQDHRHQLLAELARRRLLADEAARRRAADLSCEDLPNLYEFDPRVRGISPWGSQTAAAVAARNLLALNIALFGASAVTDAGQAQPVAQQGGSAENDGLDEASARPPTVDEEHK